MEILKGERLSAWSKVLYPPNFSQLSSPTQVTWAQSWWRSPERSPYSPEVTFKALLWDLSPPASPLASPSCCLLSPGHLNFVFWTLTAVPAATRLHLYSWALSHTAADLKHKVRFYGDIVGNTPLHRAAQVQNDEDHLFSVGIWGCVCLLKRM